jgi:1,4-dihydroxy-6-naphthoate synthase
MFHDLAMGNCFLPGLEFDIHLHDVETLNQFACQEEYDISKLSFYAYLKVHEHYDLLSTGAALGFGCGPVVVGKKAIKRSELLHHRIALPGQLTTAHLLFRLWAPEAHYKQFVTYDRILDLLLSGEADYGVLIHESRFTYEQAGFQKIVDLGDWWKKKTALPIPLGCVAIRKKLPIGLAESFGSLLKRSINNSLAYPERTYEYIRQYAQEMDRSILNRHIQTFVNQYSLDLGGEGRAAVAKLKEMAINEGIIEW